MRQLRDTLHGLGVAIRARDVWEHARNVLQEPGMTPDGLAARLTLRFPRLHEHEARLIAETLLEMTGDGNKAADGQTADA